MSRRAALGELAIFAIAAGAACGDVVVMNSTRDNTLYESPVGDLSNGAGPSFFAGMTNGASKRRGLVRFSVGAQVPPGSTITSVVLSLHMSQTIAADVNVSLFRVLKDWGEGASNAGTSGGGGALALPGDATWLHTFFSDQFWSGPGAVAGVDYLATSSATTAVGNPVTTYFWNSTPELVADVQAWINTPASNYGWILIGDETVIGTAKKFDSHENADPAVRPTLTVTFTPPAQTCYANCDGSATAPVLNALDFGCFLTKYAAGDTYANCDGSSTAPVLNALDFGCFLTKFAGGCT